MQTSDQSHVDFVDAASFHFGLEALEAQTGQKLLRLNFRAMADILDECSREFGWPRRSAALAYAAVDLNNEAQQRFGKSWEEAGFSFIGLDYRDCFPSVPAGRTPSDERDRLISSMLPQIAYGLGTMRRFQRPYVIVASHDFGLSSPMLELASHGARVALVYFRSLLDPRWERQADLLGNSPIKFFDIEPHAKRLIGVEVGHGPQRGGAGRSQIGF